MIDPNELTLADMQDGADDAENPLRAAADRMPPRKPAPPAKRKSGPSGKHAEPRRKLSAPQEAWDLWERAREHALDDSWAEWARNVLTIAAADELGIDPQEALAEVGL